MWGLCDEERSKGETTLAAPGVGRVVSDSVVVVGKRR